MHGYQSTFSLAPLMLAVVAAWPVRHYVYGNGQHAARVSTRFATEAERLTNAKEYKTETAAKAALTRRAKG